MQIINRMTVESAALFVVLVVVVPVVDVPVVVVPVVVEVVALQRRCSAGKLASASRTLRVSRQVARWVLSNAVIVPTCRQPVRALAQLIEPELADLLSAAVDAASSRYSVLDSVALGTAAAAEADTQIAAAAAATVSLVKILIPLSITSSVGHSPPY